MKRVIGNYIFDPEITEGKMLYHSCFKLSYAYRMNRKRIWLFLKQQDQTSAENINNFRNTIVAS